MSISTLILTEEQNKIYIGDPCYIVGRDELNEDDDWSMVCDLSYKEENLDEDGKTNVLIDFYSNVSDRQISLIVANTQYGDGFYPIHCNDVVNKFIPVDAGILGVVPLTSIHDSYHEYANECGVVLELDFNQNQSKTITYEVDNGTHYIRQGNELIAIIETADWLEDEDDEEDYYEDNEGCCDEDEE